MKIATLLAQAYRQRKYVSRFLLFRASDDIHSGAVPDDELETLRALVAQADALPGPIVEIGALFGFTTQRLAEWKRPDKELIAVEDFSWNPMGIGPNAHRQLTHRVLRHAIDNLHTRVFQGRNTDFYASYRGPAPAMVFIDADHKYQSVRTDIAWARDTGVPIISGHDYRDDHVGVRRAVDEAFGDARTVRGTVWFHGP